MARMVPRVPGAKGLKPLPNPNDKKWPGSSNKRQCGFLRLFIFIFVDIDDYHNVFCETIIPWLIALDRKVNYVYY